MAMNDHIRFVRDESGYRIELRNDPGSDASVFHIKEGRVVLPQSSQDGSAFETGSVWNDTPTGDNKQKDSGGVTDL